MIIDLITGFFLNKIIVILIDAVAILLAFLVYRDNPKGVINKIYLLMTVFMMMWVNFAYLPRIMGQYDHDLGLLFLRIAWFAAPLFLALLYIFTVYLINKGRKYRTLNNIIILIGIILAIISGFTNWTIADFVFIGNVVRILYGPFMYPFLAGISLIMVATFVFVYKDRHLARNKNVSYFLGGLFVFYILNTIFNITLPIFFDISRFYFFGDYSTLILLSLTAYAIIRHHLFSLKTIAAELFVFVLWIIISFELFFAENAKEQLIDGTVLFFAITIGIFLIKSVKKEVAQREHIEKLAEDLVVANEKLKGLDKLKSEFLSLASHQLRSPLTAIKGYTSMLVEGSYGKLEEKQNEIVGHVQSIAQSMISMVEDFLNVSKIEQGGMQYVFAPTDLSKIVANLFGEMKISAENKHLEFALEMDAADTFTVNADAGKLKQVFLNLVDNSIKYTPSGFVRVSLVRNKGENTVTFSVKDSGVGVSPETKEKLFQKFNRGEGGKLNTGGSGIGLYLAKEITEAHHGEIVIESEGLGKGSSFKVVLPLDPVHYLTAK